MPLVYVGALAERGHAVGALCKAADAALAARGQDLPAKVSHAFTDGGQGKPELQVVFPNARLCRCLAHV